MKKLMKYLKEEDGLVAIEYALIGLLVAVAITATVLALGGRLVLVLEAIVAALSTVV
jgi:pilus assembly protein Flp/PilA